MAKNITTTVTILGKDALSPVVATASQKSINQLQKLNKQSSAIASGAFGLAKSSAVVGTGIMAPLIYAGKEAAEFEAKMVGLGKVANIDLGDKRLENLATQAKEGAYHLGRMPSEVAATMKALKQSGLAVNELKDIAIFTGEAGVAFDMTADKAGDAFGSIRSAMGLSLNETKAVFDAVNEISNKMKAEPEKLISFFTAGGSGVASALKIQGNEIAAFGATLIQAGKSGEEAATLLERAAKNTMAKKALNAVYERGGKGTKGLLNVLQTGIDLPEKRQQAYFKQFGEYSLEIRNLASNMNKPGGLRDALALVSSEEKYAMGVHKEFTAVQKSTLEQARKEWVNFKVAVIEFGTQGLPVFRQLLTDIKPVITEIGGWIRQNPELTGTLIKGAAATAAFAFAVSGVSTVVGAAATAVKGYTIAMGWFKAGGALFGATTAVQGFGAAMWTAAAGATVLGFPLYVVAAAIGVVGYAAYKAYEKIEPFHEMIIALTTAVQALADHAGPAISKFFKGDFSGAWGELKAANAQTQLNTQAHMAEWRANKRPAGPTLTQARLSEIEQSRRNRELKALATAGDKRNVPGYNILDRLGLGAPGKEPDWIPKPIPVPQNLPGVSTGTTISFSNNPIFNLSGSVSEDQKKDLLTLSDQMAQKFRRQLEDAQRNKNRTALE